MLSSCHNTGVTRKHKRGFNQWQWTPLIHSNSLSKHACSPGKAVKAVHRQDRKEIVSSYFPFSPFHLHYVVFFFFPFSWSFAKANHTCQAYEKSCADKTTPLCVWSEISYSFHWCKEQLTFITACVSFSSVSKRRPHLRGKNSFKWGKIAYNDN